MYDAEADLLTLEDIKSAYATLKQSPAHLYRRTPLIAAEHLFGIKDGIKLFLKLENTQVTGE